jgi:hypothetical protein
MHGYLASRHRSFEEIDANSQPEHDRFLDEEVYG